RAGGIGAAGRPGGDAAPGGQEPSGPAAQTARQRRQAAERGAAARRAGGARTGADRDGRGPASAGRVAKGLAGVVGPPRGQGGAETSRPRRQGTLSGGESVRTLIA